MLAPIWGSRSSHGGSGRRQRQQEQEPQGVNGSAGCPRRTRVRCRLVGGDAAPACSSAGSSARKQAPQAGDVGWSGGRPPPRLGTLAWPGGRGLRDGGSQQTYRLVDASVQQQRPAAAAPSGPCLSASQLGLLGRCLGRVGRWRVDGTALAAVPEAELALRTEGRAEATSVATPLFSHCRSLRRAQLGGLRRPSRCC